MRRLLVNSAHDISPVAAQMQASARDFSRLARDPTQRKSLDDLIGGEIVPGFLDYAVTRSAVYRNQWLGSLGTGNYGANYWMRSAVNLVGLWANTSTAVVYYVATVDADGRPLNGADDYVLEFPADSRPETVVHSYWSIILVDVPDYRVVPNPMNRFSLNGYSGLQDQADCSLKILVSSAPGTSVPDSNWLPAPDGKGFSLTIRLYVPKDVVKRGEWFPPAMRRVVKQ